MNRRDFFRCIPGAIALVSIPQQVEPLPTIAPQERNARGGTNTHINIVGNPLISEADLKAMLRDVINDILDDL